LFITNKQIHENNNASNQFNLSKDFLFHYGKTSSVPFIDEGHPLSSYYGYPYLSHLIATPFSFRLESFYIFNLLVMGLVLPFLLFKLTNHPITVFFYFTTTSLFYELEFSGLLPETFSFVLLLTLFLTKNNYLRAGILFLALITHMHGVWLILIAWGLILASENKNYFLACVPLFQSKAGIFYATFIDRGASLSKLLFFSVKGFPFPFIVFSVKQLVKEKKYVYLSLAGIGFVASLFVNDRTLHLTELFLLVGLTFYYAQSSWKMKASIIAMSFLVFTLELLQWYRMKIGSLGVPC
jgi:hypothetical protein